ncbi:putative aldouronate transport system permease protein [Cohnella sp. OV330]|uniref:carbohydrate ABC transporter permease n=1 Tax=Cohnella sp. OV330 TaxID=1855288 RepID=UPI0008EB73C5|nr:carbohydrate ABC transporter permease [Cohnella sp. OV330]SFA77455.1 putative aldouronate transport system permease protein [Cohnella sp. OV330]
MATSVIRKRKFNANEISTGTNAVINTIFWIYSALCVIPLLIVVAVSLSDEKTVTIEGYNIWPKKFSLGAYDFLLNDWKPIVHSYGVSIFVTVVGTIVALSIMTLYAYPISRRDFKHRGIFSFIVFFTILFNSGLVPFYLTYKQGLHLQNTMLVLMLPMFVQGFFVILIRTFFSGSIPPALIESAKIDGAGELRTFVRIVLPLSLPVLASVGLLCTLNYWNDWFLSLLFINQDGPMSIQFRMYKTLLDIAYLSSNSQAYSAIMQANPNFRMPSETARMAMAVVGIGPIIFIYPFFQRYFIQGLTVGAVKG